jgi:hypothetical protein
MLEGHGLLRFEEGERVRQGRDAVDGQAVVNATNEIELQDPPERAGFLFPGGGTHKDSGRNKDWGKGAVGLSRNRHG